MRLAPLRLSVLLPRLAALLLCLTAILSLSACSNERQGYVVYVEENGFVAHVGGLGRVYVAYAGASEQIKVADSVTIEPDGDVTESGGTYVTPGGETERYDYRMTAKQVQVSDPAKGDPVLG